MIKKSLQCCLPDITALFLISFILSAARGILMHPLLWTIKMNTFTALISGGKREYPRKHRRRSGRSVSYQLEVSKEDFEKISRKIREKEDSKEQLHYSRLGVIFCLMGIPFRRKNHYFCSQFVTEMLKRFYLGRILPCIFRMTCLMSWAGRDA